MPLNFLIIIRATLRLDASKKEVMPSILAMVSHQSHDTRGGKGRGGGTGQWGLCSVAVHAERGTNDEGWLARHYSRHVACTSRYGPCTPVVAQ